MTAPQPTRVLEELVYELLDAHSDTLALIVVPAEPTWDAHLDYLRALQRRARSILAETTTTSTACHPPEPGEASLAGWSHQS